MESTQDKRQIRRTRDHQKKAPSDADELLSHGAVVALDGG